MTVLAGAAIAAAWAVPKAQPPGAWRRLVEGARSPACEMLDGRQRAWLASALAASAAPLKLVASGSVLAGSLGHLEAGGTSDGCDGDEWHCYGPAQANALHALANASGCVVVLTGNDHISDIKVGGEGGWGNVCGGRAAARGMAPCSLACDAACHGTMLAGQTCSFRSTPRAPRQLIQPGEPKGTNYSAALRTRGLAKPVWQARARARGRLPISARRRLHRAARVRVEDFPGPQAPSKPSPSQHTRTHTPTPPQIMASGLSRSTARSEGAPCEGSWLHDIVGLRPLGPCAYVPQPAFGLVEVDWAARRVALSIRDGGGGGVAAGKDGSRQRVVFSLDSCLPVDDAG